MDDAIIEQRRLDLIRIVFGALCVHRNVLNLSTAVDLGNPAVIRATAVASVLSLMMTAGILAPFATAALGVLLIPWFDIVADTFNLASSVASMCCMAFAMAPVGRSLSVDAVILRSRTIVGQLWRWLYDDLCGPFTLNRAALAKCALMVAYSGIAFSAALLHLKAANWRHGITNAWVFINPVMNPNYYASFDKLYGWSPVAYLAMIRATVYGTLVFQIGFVPLLLLSRWTRRLVVFLELGFVFGSITLLALHLLGWFQLGVCVILFWNQFRLNVNRRDRVEVFFDDQCNVCDRVFRALSAVDLFKVIEARPLSRNADRISALGLQASQVTKDLHGADQHGRVSQGYDLYVVLVSRIFLLLPLWPILVVGRVTSIGPRIYRAVASGRHGLLNSCAVPTHTGSRRPILPPASLYERRYSWSFCGFLAAFTILFCAFAVRLPATASGRPWLVRASAMSERVFGDAPYAFGLMKVDAFNFPPLSGTLPTFELSWRRGDGEPRFLFSLPASRADIPVSDMLFYQAQTTFSLLKYDGTCFPEGFSRNFMDRLAIKAVLRRDEYRGGEFRLRMSAYDIPSAGDFLSYHYVPLRFYRVCEATFPADTLGPLTFTYFQEGIDAMAPRSPLPFSVAVEAVPLARNYPCRAEADRVAYWSRWPAVFSAENDLAERVSRLTAAAQKKTGVDCLADALPAIAVLHTDLGFRLPGARPDNAVGGSTMPGEDEVDWTASAPVLKKQLTDFYNKRGVATTEVPYWVSKAPELLARGKELGNPLYASQRLAESEVFWHSDTVPLDQTSCDADLASAGAMIAAGLRSTEAQRHFEGARTELQRGNVRGCLAEAAAVHQTYYSTLRSPTRPKS